MRLKTFKTCQNLSKSVKNLCPKLNIPNGPALASSNKTISDGGITVDFSIIKVHTSN